MKTPLLCYETFRPGTLYTLVEYQHADEAIQEHLRALHNTTDVYGVFSPISNAPGLTVKVAPLQAALLYRHLQQYQTLPHYFVAAFDEEKNELLAHLVLDGVLQIKWQGTFVSGSAAVAAVMGDSFCEDDLPSFLARLSLKALYSVWRLPCQDLPSLATRLYTYNTTPWDGAMRQAFISKQPISDFLFGTSMGLLKKELDTRWSLVSSSLKRGWLSWVRSPAEAIEFQQTHKLYISPVLEDLPRVLSKAIPVIDASAAISFKTGSTIQGLLRPDKLVVYFTHKSPLVETAHRLETLLDNCRVQGVPFSAQLDQKGLLSYGLDPIDEDVTGTIEEGSWRTQITNKLALALMQAKKEGLDWPQSLRYIKACCIADGIDPATWMVA